MYASQKVISLRGMPLAASDSSPTTVAIENLFGSLPTDKIAAGRALFREGDAASQVFEIESGCVRLYRILPNGRRAVIGFGYAGDVLGVGCKGTYLVTAEAITPVRFRRLARGRLQAMAAESDLIQSFVTAKLREEVSTSQQHIVVLGQLRAEERLAYFLVSAARRARQDPSRPAVLELLMTRLDIADHLGLTIETVCRLMSKLKRIGLIASQGRHWLVLRRMNDLRNLAGELVDAGDAGQFTLMQSSARWPS